MRHNLVLPDLGLKDASTTAGRWYVEPGGVVIQGDRVLEIVTDAATVDLPSPVSGRLLRTLVEKDQWLSVGQHLAVIRCDEAND